MNMENLEKKRARVRRYDATPKAKAKRKIYVTTNREALRDYQRNWHFQRSYGITLEEYIAMLKAQRNRCAACGTRNPGGRTKRFHVDHCHKTGKVRGLLCSACNVAAGQLRDEAERALMLALYLSGETDGGVRSPRITMTDIKKLLKKVA